MKVNNDKITSNEIGQRVSRILINKRLMLKLNREDIAEATGISTASLARIESNQSDPKLSSLISICDALGLALDEVMTEAITKEKEVPLKMNNGQKTLSVMSTMKSNGLLPAHWTVIESEFQKTHGFKPKDFNQILADLSHARYSTINYPSIGRAVFKRVKRGTYDM